jgi:C-5 cytosine-specific DNA methylase
MSKPLAIDLYAGLGGWASGFLAEDYDVIGFDIERHQYGDHCYPAQLVIQDVLTLHGSQFKNAAIIVASPPCQEYSYMAMPWKRAKAKAAVIRADTTGNELARLNRLFNACLRIQFEASIAAGRHVPMVIENVKGAQPWVGRARWSFGSFYLWGDVPALMPIAFRAAKVPGLNWSGSDKLGYVAQGFNTVADQRCREGIKVGDAGWRERGPGRQFLDRAIKNNGGSWFNVAHNTTSGNGRNPDGRDPMFRRGFTQTAADRLGDGLKQGGDWFNSSQPSMSRLYSSKSKNRRMASAMIAKIPLARHIAACYRP